MNRILNSLVVPFALLIHSASAQLPPSTDIWLVPIKMVGEVLQTGTPENITHRPGYDNQPSFFPDGSALLYTSLQTNPPGPQAPTQTDIFRYDTKSKHTTRVTTTPESEYSPTVMPGGTTFSVVRVEPDSTQRLWQLDMAGQQPAVILPGIKAIGYHAWINRSTVALFVIGNPLTLQIADVGTGNVDTVFSNIGRSIHKVPGKNSVGFVHKISGNEWWIKELSVSSRTESKVMQTVEGKEDYAWTPYGFVVMAQDSKLFMYKTGHLTQWTEFADFSEKNIKSITRIAISPNGDWLAFVAAE